MNKHIIKQIVLTGILSFSIVILSGCSTSYVSKSYNTNTIEIQVLKPAGIEIPNGISRYGIVFVDTKRNDKPLQITISDKEITHINARKSCLNGLHKYLTDAQILDTAKVIITNINMLKDSINWNEVISFCEINNVDAIIILKRFKLNSTSQSGSYYSGTKYNDLELKTTWTVLLPSIEKRIEKEIVYNKYGKINDGKDQFIYNASEACGAKFGTEIIPGWSTTKRKYYTSSNQEFKLATDFVEEGNWEDASKLWNTYLASENKTLAGKAHFNMALYFEIQGDLDQAFELAKKADKIFEVPQSHLYAGMLFNRIKDQFKLAEQLN